MASLALCEEAGIAIPEDFVKRLNSFKKEAGVPDDEWRPWRHGLFSPPYWQAMRTLLIMAKAEEQQGLRS